VPLLGGEESGFAEPTLPMDVTFGTRPELLWLPKLVGEVSVEGGNQLAPDVGPSCVPVTDMGANPR